MTGKAGIMKLGMSWISWMVYQCVSCYVFLIDIQGRHTQASLQVVAIGIGTVIVANLSLIQWQSWLDNLFRLAVSAGRGCWFCCNMCWYNQWGHGLQWDYNLILYGAVVITIGCQACTDTLAIILGTIWYAGIVFLRFGWSAIQWAEWNFYINISCAVEITALVIGEWEAQCDWLWSLGSIFCKNNVHIYCGHLGFSGDTHNARTVFSILVLLEMT